MKSRAAQQAFVPLFFLSCIVVSCTAFSQVMSIPSSGFGNIGTPGISGSPIGLGLIDSMSMTNNLFTMTTNAQNHSNQSPSASVSKLDLKAPWRARREYEKGYQLLMRKDFQDAVLQLSNATAMYPNFVAAHNALGSAYLNLGQNDRARDEFAQAVALDDHLPNSHLNLGCAELALGHYAAAEASMQKASAIAPLDLQLLTARAYGEFMNHDYPAVVATAQQVHERKHRGAAVVHYFAAGALDAEGKFADEQGELNAIIQEEPLSTAATQARQVLDQIKVEQARRAEAKLHPAEPVTFTAVAPAAPTREESARHAQAVLQDLKEKQQIADAEAEPEPTCTVDCGETRPSAATTTDAKLAPGPIPSSKGPGAKYSQLHTLRASVDEVALFFTATDHGKSVMGLTGADIAIQDDRKPPTAIIGFRNEAQLPLRLGLVIDTSDSIGTRFSFEQHAAINFLQKAVTDQNDLAFVVGVANSVLVVQDFTNDQKKISHAIDQLTPSGGTALWDAVGFAADKLASHREEHPVAKILVVISDGEDNSSNIALKDAIRRAQHGEVAVYTVSTRDYEHEEASALLGDHALRTLAELTGGTTFTPGSIHRLNGSLGDLQQVLRGRYLISYKPALFERDGRYRTIDITAQKDGHKLRVYARRGYYASVAQ
jgi:VWFA-related protein